MVDKYPVLGIRCAEDAYARQAYSCNVKPNDAIGAVWGRQNIETSFDPNSKPRPLKSFLNMGVHSGNSRLAADVARHPLA